MMWLLQALTPAASLHIGNRISIVRLIHTANQQPRIRLYDVAIDAHLRGIGAAYQDIPITQLQTLNGTPNRQIPLSVANNLPANHQVLSIEAYPGNYKYCSADNIEVIF